MKIEYIGLLIIAIVVAIDLIRRRENKTFLETEKKQFLKIIYYAVATISVMFYHYKLNSFNDSFTNVLAGVLGVLFIPALISYAINRSKYKKFNNYYFSRTLAISSVILCSLAYLGNTSKFGSHDTINEPVQKSIQKSPERTIQKRTIQKIVVYGSNKSSDCNELTKQLKKRGLKYIFNDIDENDIFSRDLVKLVKDSGHKGGFAIPVVVINDAHVIIGADIDEIMRSK